MLDIWEKSYKQIEDAYRNKLNFCYLFRFNFIRTMLSQADIDSFSFLFMTAADILLWRDKKISIGVLGVATLIWALFELIEYHLLSLLCHTLILVLGIHFLWSNTFNLFYR